MEGPAQRLHIVAVHHDGVEAKGLHPGLVNLHFVFQGSCLALAEPRGGGGRGERGRGGEGRGGEGRGGEGRGGHHV